jgi:Flp pilus assembly protein TadD
VQRGRDALARNDLAATSVAAEERLKADARDVDALELRYLVHVRRGDLTKAAETLQTVIACAPHADWAFNNLTTLLFNNGRRADAEQVARAALRANPRNAQGHNLFGTILSELNDLTSGEWHFRRALELGGPQAPVLANLALNLMQQGRVEESDAYFAQADQLAPGNMQTLAHWSKLCELRGDLARAETLLSRAEAASSKADVDLLRAGFLARAGRPAEALAIIDAAPSLGGHGQLERGRLRDRLGRYDEAWQDFVAAKHKLAKEAGGLEYKADVVDLFFSRLKRFFVRRNIELLPQASVRNDAPQPIFIIGFPRSGTTLLEQVLSSHSAVAAGGELAFLGETRRLATLLLPSSDPFPENLAQSWTADNRHVATLLRDHYLARAEQSGLFNAGKAFFTDKMPFNEMYLPLLKMAFPAAKIVRVIRNPLDVCISMLSNNLTHGFNCGYRIEDTVRHFVAVFELFEHYRREMPIGDFALHYERFVRDPEGEAHKLFEYLGLPFEAASLKFHESRRYAPTPSYAQVTEPLNDRSIDRHKHYAAHLQPFVARLVPLLTAHGYSIS